MIIKLYARGATPHLHIIQHVSAVTVDSRTVNAKVFEMGNKGKDIVSYEHLDFDDEDDCRLIWFRQDGIETGVLVYGKAYVCNDDGRTIEVVKPDEGFGKGYVGDTESVKVS